VNLLQNIHYVFWAAIHTSFLSKAIHTINLLQSCQSSYVQSTGCSRRLRAAQFRFSL